MRYFGIHSPARFCASAPGLSAAAVLQADSTIYDAQPKSSSIITIEAARKKPGRDAGEAGFAFCKPGERR